MGFNHCYLTSVENLQNELNNKGLENFIKSYRKYDAVTGPSECFRFLEEKIKEYEEVINIVDNSNGSFLQKGIGSTDSNKPTNYSIE